MGSQVFVNCMLLFSNGFIVEELAISDIATIWAYDFSWLIIIDLVKMGILNATEGPTQSVADVQGRSRSKSVSKTSGSTAVRRSGAPKLSKEVRVSVQGTPMVK